MSCVGWWLIWVDNAALEEQVTQLGDQLATVELARAAFQTESQDLRDEIARLKNLPPRPPFKPSGMEKVTEKEARKSSGLNRPGFTGEFVVQ